MTDRADQISSEITREVITNGAMKVDSVREPAVWGTPAELANNLIVEVGRKGEDVLYHLWHPRFPHNFDELLHDVVERVTKAPERFQASFTEEVAAVWDRKEKTLTVGPTESIFRQPEAQFRAQYGDRFIRVRSYAVRAVGYIPIVDAHERITKVFLTELSAALE